MYLPRHRLVVLHARPEESAGAPMPLVIAEEDSTYDGTLHKDSPLWTVFLATEAAYAPVIPVCW